MAPSFPTFLLSSCLLSSCLGLAAGLPAQDPAEAVQKPQSPPARESAAPDVGALIDQLGAESYRDRLDAERALRKHGAAAVDALKKAADSHGDAEVQWRARRLLRAIERGDSGLVERSREPVLQRDPASPRDASPLRGDDAGELRRRFESMFERFEREFGLDIPRAGFFGDGFFKDLEEQLQHARGQSQGMTMQIGPDGAVRVEIQERAEDGSTSNKVYEAPSLREFQEQYPGVLRQGGIGGLGFGMAPWTGADPFSGRFGPMVRGFDPRDATRQVVPFGRAPTPPDAPRATDAAPPADRRLGVLVKDVPEAVREYLELPAGEGLMVESVEPGTLAQRLGLAAGDIVVAIGAHRVGSPADVAAALGGIAAGDPVVVEFVRRGRTEQREAKKPDAAPEQKDGPKSGPKTESSESPGRLKRRDGGGSIR
jgi:hypothetical protein